MNKITKVLKKITQPKQITFWPNEWNLEEVEKFSLLDINHIITIESNDPENEVQYLEYLKKIVNILKKHNRKYCVKIKINNRELLRQADILETSNINFIINSDGYEYDLKEYLKEEEQLDRLIAPIKDVDLSPYEKYLAVYGIVKNFKPYKENNYFPNRSRYLRYILNNKYIVCVGYSTLLKTLLDKVGIPSIQISVNVHGSGLTSTMNDHARNIVKIDDDKYNIHGIYIGDATWDTDAELDLYANASLTFDKKKEYTEIEFLSEYDLLLDFHDFDEFNTKINYLLKKLSKFYNGHDNMYKVIMAYKKIYNKIMNILSRLDYNEYKDLFDKYHRNLQRNRRDHKILEKIYAEFLTEYAIYILRLTNNAINLDTLLTALKTVKEKLNNYSKEELVDFLSINQAGAESLFPYIYDPNNKDNYLEIRQEKNQTKK